MRWRTNIGEVFENPPALVTTSYVLDEVVTFFNAAAKHAKAVELGEILLSSPSITMIHADEALLRRGFDLLRNRADKRYSLTDCISYRVRMNGSPFGAFS